MYENKITTVDFENCCALKDILGVTFWPYIKSSIDQAFSVKMAGYWPILFFVFLNENTKKKNLANVQLSCPHAWSKSFLFYFSGIT